MKSDQRVMYLEKHIFVSFQVEIVPDELVPGHSQDQEEDDLLVVVRHPQEGVRRRPQSHPVQRRRRPRKGLHRRHPQVHGQEVGRHGNSTRKLRRRKNENEQERMKMPPRFSWPPRQHEEDPPLCFHNIP